MNENYAIAWAICLPAFTITDQQTKKTVQLGLFNESSLVWC